MEVDVFNMNGEKVSTLEIPAGIFDAPIRIDLMHQAYVRQMANLRAGTHSTKTRSEVRGGGRKPWRQKGTGRARQGSIRSPQWVGGGKVHTPKPRDYSVSMPQKMRRSAMRSALSAKAADNGLVFVDQLALSEPKTRLMAQALEKLTGDASVLVLLPDKSEDHALVDRATRNLPNARTLLANYVNIRDLLSFDKVLIPVQAIEVLESFLS